MSFDNKRMKRLRGTQISLNPFRAGQCLSTAIPDEVFQAFFRLNPFRTGQCLSTAEGDILLIIQQVIQGLPKIFEELNS